MRMFTESNIKTTRHISNDIKCIQKCICNYATMPLPEVKLFSPFLHCMLEGQEANQFSKLGKWWPSLTFIPSSVHLWPIAAIASFTRWPILCPIEHPRVMAVPRRNQAALRLGVSSCHEPNKQFKELSFTSPHLESNQFLSGDIRCSQVLWSGFLYSDAINLVPSAWWRSVLPPIFGITRSTTPTAILWLDSTCSPRWGFVLSLASYRRLHLFECFWLIHITSPNYVQ